MLVLTRSKMCRLNTKYSFNYYRHVFTIFIIYGRLIGFCLHLTQWQDPGRGGHAGILCEWFRALPRR